MKIIKKASPFLLGVLLFGLVSCSNEGSVSYSDKVVANQPLVQVLKQKGYVFNNEGKLELNDLARQTVSLDLSSTNLTDFTGLDALPNLTEVNLQNNGYKMSFDFSTLPTQITGIDLRGNELYEFEGLAEVKVEENGDETVNILRPLKKLFLPEGAKYNGEEVLGFYEKNKNEIDNGTIDMQMVNAGGRLEKYNTLREVPDEGCRKRLKESFPSLFTGEKIDMAKRIVNAEEKSRTLLVTTVKNAEGVQYVIHNRSYMGLDVSINSTAPTVIPYLKMKSTFTSIQLDNLSTPNGIDFSRCVNLVRILLANNHEIKELNCSASKKIGQRGLHDEFFATTDSWVIAQQCEKLETVKLPKDAKIVSIVNFLNLPSLKKMDLSQIECISVLELNGIQAEITFPDIQYFSRALKIDNTRGRTYLSIDENMFKHQSTKDFINKYGKNLRGSSPTIFSDFIKEIPEFDWAAAL